MVSSREQSLLPKTDIVPTASVVKMIGAIDQFNGMWRATKDFAPHLLSALEQAALVSSTGSSTRIEGTQLDDAEVERVLLASDTKMLTSSDEQEVAGYAAAVREVIREYPSLTVSEEQVKHLHSTMLQYSSKDSEHRGRYKIMPNRVTVTDQISKRRVVWLQTTAPEDTPRLMAELITWFNYENDAELQHRLLLIAVFIVVLLAIHPFQDGNGRISRLLTTLLLLKSGYTYVPYSSMESIIEARKDDYYHALRFTQQTLPTAQQNWQPWLNFFIAAMQQQKDRLASKLATERELQGVLSPIARKILEFIDSRGDASIGDIVTRLGIARNVVRTQLRLLVTQQYLTMVGKGRATRYVKK